MVGNKDITAGLYPTLWKKKKKHTHEFVQGTVTFISTM